MMMVDWWRAGSDWKIIRFKNNTVTMNEYSSSRAKGLAGRKTEGTRVAWIDAYSLTREAIALSLTNVNPDVDLAVFGSIQDCIAKGDDGFALILFYSHGSSQDCVRATSALRIAFPRIRLVILSDLESYHQAELARDLLNAGADGLISTRVMGMSVASSAVRFVQSGDACAAFEPVSTATIASAFRSPKSKNGCDITPRQRDVLIQLQRGKSNKIIAYELGMSESTAKVHIRNLMKKMGASNRTQVAFNAMKLCPDLMDRP
ncbi:response regulator transcription factor [Acidisoma cellulosilytica]|uniref:Response regulator transcription factor n=1 Tax=Acidisoma cellulosilyticum TaxID=2802395 RepID=A0A963Z2S4_9PROT|nr:response regulator transcription factor [Acidisoma cellulosilyticum]MCB8881797.1 response regulator transcription factor [Acidisoma cellulosilyticum]